MGLHVSVATFYILVEPLDEAPILLNQQFTYYLNEDSTLSLELNATDPENPSSSVSYQVTNPQNGNLSGTGPQYTYTPESNFNGVDQFKLTLQDANSNRVEHNITLIVNSVNDLPVAKNDQFYDLTYTSGTQIVLPVLQNDSSAPDLNETLFISAITSVQKWDGTGWVIDSGILSVNGAKTDLLFEPSGLGFGFYKFSYSVSDGTDQTSADVEFLIRSSSSLPGWQYLKNFGFYSPKSDQWIYHSELGWLYLSQANGQNGFTWMWSETLGWIWTGDQHPTKELSFPYFYSEHLSAWCNIQFLGNGLAQTLSSGNWVLYKYELDNSTVTYTSSEFIQLLEALKIEAERNEFQSLLNSKNDIASVLQVIRDSSFFYI